MKKKIVEIIYEDITLREDIGEDVLTASSPKLLKLYGVLFELDGSYKIIWNWDEDRKEHDAMIVPKKNIIKITELVPREPKKRKKRRRKKR